MRKELKSSIFCLVLTLLVVAIVIILMLTSIGGIVEYVKSYITPTKDITVKKDWRD